MYTGDRETFVELLDQLAMTFARKKPADELVQTYWSALRDVTMQTVRSCAERHMRYGKFFPRPFELRPKEDKPPAADDAGSQAKFEAALRFSTESWEILRRDDPELFRMRMREAQLARLEVTTHESSPAHEQIRLEAGRCAAERLAAGMARW